MDEIPRNSDQAAEYEKEIQELRWQIQQLQEAGNIKDYSGRALYVLFLLWNITDSPNNYFAIFYINVVFRRSLK